jgi:hypothetical protein
MALVAILKILKTKSTTLSDDLFLCQVSKGSAVWSEFNIFCTLVTISRLFAKQKLMKLDRNNIHIWWNEITICLPNFVWGT